MTLKQRTGPLAALTALTLAGSLAACSGDSAQSDDGSGTSDASQGSQTLEVWTRSDEVAAVNYEAVFAAFTDETGIEIDYVPDPDLGTRLQTAAAAGDLPDIVINDSAALGSYQSQGLLQSVDRQSIDSEGNVRDDAWDGAKGLDGTYYGVPYSRHAMGTGIRADWLEALDLEAPTTMEEFLDVATAFATQDPDGNGQDDAAGWSASLTSANGFAAVWTAPFLWAYGGDFVTETGDGTYEAATSTDESVAGMEAAMSVVCADPAVVQASAITDATGDAANLFYAGGSGMYSLGPWQMNNLDENVGAENWAVITPPTGPAGPAALAEGENVYLLAGSESPEGQQALAQFLISEEGQTLGMTEGTVPSVRLSVTDSLDAGEVREDDRWATIQEIYDTAARSFPVALDFGAIRTAAGETFNAIYTDCEADPRPALEELDAQITEILTTQGAAK